MKYINQDSSGTFHLEAYEEYLDANRDTLRRFVSGDDLLSRPRFFSFSEKEGFHDARLETVNVDHAAARIDLKLRGPFFDRTFLLKYERVLESKIQAPSTEDDLLVHELRVEGDRLVHEFLFDRNQVLRIECRKLEFTETVTADSAE